MLLSTGQSDKKAEADITSSNTAWGGWQGPFQ